MGQVISAPFRLLGNLFKSPSVNVPPPPPSAIPPTLADPSVQGAGAKAMEAARKAAGAGYSGTVTNEGGPQGVRLGGGDLAAKSLLG